MLDALLVFGEDEAVTTTAIAANKIPLDCVINAEAHQLKVNICCTEGVVGATSIRFVVGLANSSNTVKELGSVSKLAADLTAGTLIPIIVPIGFMTEEDYKAGYTNLVLQYNVTGTGTKGKFTSSIELYPQTNH